VITRTVTARGEDAQRVASEVIAGLGHESLRFAIVFGDYRLDPGILAREITKGLGAGRGAPRVVGCTTVGVIGAGHETAPPAVSAIGFYGDRIRAGIGVARLLRRSPIVASREAVYEAAEELGTHPEPLSAARHVAITLVDGTSGHEDAFCVGSALAAPQLRMVGGAASTTYDRSSPSYVWADGELLVDGGVVVLVETDVRFEVVTSQHFVPTDLRTVVTAGSARTIEELDGIPAARRFRQMIDQLGAKLDETRPSEYSFARFIDGVPYVRAVGLLDGDRIQLASTVEPGHVLHLVRPGDLIGRTRLDLAAAAERLGGRITALIAFSCLGRHWEARARGLEPQLAAIYGAYPSTGMQSAGEQSGMLLVNQTLTALALGSGVR
jgi:hypothetical protein